MSKKKNKKKKLDNVITLTEVSARLRGFLIDSQVKDAHELAVLLGCSPLSPEVREMEDEESDKRIERITHLIPLLYAQAHALAESSMEHQKLNNSKEIEGLSEEDQKDYRKALEQIAMSALVGSVSQLVDMGLLKLHLL